MSDVENTQAVPTTPEVTTATVPTNDVEQPEDPSTYEPPTETVNLSIEQIVPPTNANGKDPKKGDKESAKEGETKKTQPCPPPQSRCKVRSRDMRQCKKHFREMIGKHEIRNDELEQRETDLRQRMEMLECSMPAVMVWNIWRMAQGAPVSHLRDIVEKQFLEPASGFAACPSRPSQHWDCRVREVEAERKQALHRAEEARHVFAVKGDALRFQKEQIEEARRLQDERKAQIAKLEEEVKLLRDALMKAQGDENSCETGECGEIQCRQMWLRGVSSVSSIHSTDLECLAKLQDLAEAELCMKRQIADLERRECAYMRTLQQADEMWAKMEDDNASNLGDLREQLHAKISANQQLADRIVELEDEIEKLRTQLTKTSAILDEYGSKTYANIALGDVSVSTKDEIEQTEDQVEETKVSEGEADDGNKLSKSSLAKTEDTEQLQKDDVVKYPQISESDQTQLGDEETKAKTPAPEPAISEIKNLGVVDRRTDSKEIQVARKISTAEGAVQIKPESKEAVTQSAATTPNLEKETATEEPARVESAMITETVEDGKMLSIAEIGQEVPVKCSTERQQTITDYDGILESRAQHEDDPVLKIDGSRPFEDKASLAELLKAPTEDKDTEISVEAKTEDSSANQNEYFLVAPGGTVEETQRIATEPVYEKVSEEILQTIPALLETTLEPVTKVSIEAAPEPVVERFGVTSSEASIDAPPEPVIKTTPISPVELPKETAPKLVSKPDPVSLTVSAVKDTSVPVLESVTEPAIDAVPIPSPELVSKTVKEPVLEPILEAIEPMEMKSTENELAIPIETVISWHNVIVCLQKLISNCPQCSSASGKLGQMFTEIKIHLGKDAPELAKIECAKVGGEVQNSVPLSTKKGPCICKPKTCPLEGTSATVPAQANVQIQTVVDGQSQTSMPVKIPSRESKSSRSSKGSTKNRDEVKLMKIEEGTAPDPGMRRTKSIVETKDETTVTVDDIASQTEAIRKERSVSKVEEKRCVCPTGVCPKKKAEAPCGDCTPEKICTSIKKVLGKEYRSTAEAILAPAIKVQPSNELRSSQPIGDPKLDHTKSETSAMCCICGKPVTPVPSRKTTSIPMPTKLVFRSNVTLTSESSNDDFMCCSCRTKDSRNTRQKYSAISKSSEKPAERGRVSHRVKPPQGTVKTSCSREICCPCDKQEIHIFTKTLTTESEDPKSKMKPETKDVCCLAKISRDKVSRAEARRRKDGDSIKTTTSSASHSESGQASTSSSTFKGSRTNNSSDSNVCCSSIEQVTDASKKQGKGRRCACDGQGSESHEGKCVCSADGEQIVPKQEKHIEPSVSCVCPPKLFDKC